MENLPMNEAWTIQRKRKQGQRMKRKAKVIARARKRKLNRFADPQALKKRAQRAARDLIFKRLSKGKSKGEIASKQQVIAIEKKLDKYKSKIDKLAVKFLPKMKKAEAERLKQMKQGNVDPAKKPG